MRRVGHADLRLCSGPVPHYRQIVQLGGALVEYMVDELGPRETIRRFSHPIWFEAMASAMGFEWQFSGATTVTIRALAEAIRGKEDELGLHIVGGKGREARTAHVIPEELREPDIVATKVDSTLVQDGYQIYFHSIIFGEGDEWVIINQGMNTEEQLARRYHWSWDAGRFLNDAEQIAGVREDIVLDLQARSSEEARKTIMDIVHDESPRRIAYLILSLRKRPGQRTLAEYGLDGAVRTEYMPFAFRIPKRINEEAIRIARDAENFVEFIKTPGIGPSTVRGLAFVASLIYGAPISWKDPVKYTYAFGTKAGKPWMVEREEMRRAASFLRQAVEESRVGNKTKKRALMRLSHIVTRSSSQ